MKDPELTTYLMLILQIKHMTRMFVLAISSQYCSNGFSQGKYARELKSLQIVKQEVNLLMFLDNTILCTDNCK